MKLGIIFPVRNVLDLTKAAIDSIITKYPYQVYVIDDRSDQLMKDWLNGKHADSRTDIKFISDPEGSTGLAYNWNLGIQMAIEDGCDLFLILNNDIILHPQTIDNLVERIMEGDLVMATGVNVALYCTPETIKDYPVGERSETEHPDFSCFMINMRFLESIGWFDEHYNGAYMEDCDTHARIALAGEKAVTCNQCPYYHYASQTILRNPQVADEIRQRHHENQQYFASKWGCNHVNDVEDMRKVYWKTPFNDPNKTIKDW